MRIEKRIRNLEAKLTPERITLCFDDGTTREIQGPRGFLLKLWPGLSGATLDPDQAEQLDLIRRSIAAEEPGGGHLVELLRALMPDSAS
jgi:hypothetical protein